MITNPSGKNLLRHISNPLPYENPAKTKYNLWLPATFPQDHADETALGRTTASEYKEFDHLIHATHIRTAINVCEEQQLRGASVDDWSELQRMLSTEKFTWTAPNTSLENPCRYGAAVLHFKMKGDEGILQWTIGGHWSHYWIEVIDYKNSAASRILVLPKGFMDRKHIAPQTRAWLQQVKFDPRKRGGPWYWDEQNDKHYFLTKSSAFLSGNLQTHIVEFVRLGDFAFPNNALGISFVNHGFLNAPMNGYLCKKYFKNCEENISARMARVRFYFTMACRSYQDLSLFFRHNCEEKEHLRTDFIELLNELHSKGNQVNFINDSDVHNERVEAYWFGLSRAIAEGQKKMAIFFARNFTQEQLWYLIRQKLFLTEVLSVHPPLEMAASASLMQE